MKRFFLRKGRIFPAESQSTPARNPRQKTFVLNCPHCQFSQEVPFSGLSTFCKNCHNVINLEKVFRPTAISEKEKPPLKWVHCFYCKNEQAIPNNALSAFCKKCGRRINLQNYKITGKFNGNLETQGILHITSSGELRSNIVCHTAIVEGKVRGNIRALDRVELRQTAVMNGSIEALNLVMQEGAAYNGKGKIIR